AGGTDGAGPIRSPLRRAAVTGRIFKDLLALRAPALDGAVDALFLAAGGIPQRDEARVFRSRPLGFLERVERDADRDRHAFAADDALTVPERRDRVEETARAFGHRRLHERLVAVVVEAHRDDRAALRQHAFGKVRRALRDQAEADAVLAAFLGDAAEDAADRRAVGILLVGHVAVRLFAYQQYRPRLFLARPEREVEHYPAEDGDHRGGDVRRHTRDVDDRNRLASARHAEDPADEVGHRVADQHAREHELVARVVPDLVDLGLEPHV